MGRRRDLSIGRRSATSPDPDDNREALDAGLGARLRATRRGRGRGAPDPGGMAEPRGPTGRFWVPGIDESPGTMLLLPDAPRGVLARGLRWIVLVACFFAGAVIATAAFPWVRTALDVAVDEVRSVTEAGFAHSPEHTAAGALPAGAGRP